MARRFAIIACALAIAAASASGSVVVYTQDLPHSIVYELESEPAGFGTKLRSEGLRGLLVRSDPTDGCSALVPPPLPNDFGKWIVLISRYGCAFDTKVRNAQAAGYDAVIVHNVNSSELETMTTQHPNGIDIPSVFVSDLAGWALDTYLYKYGYYITLFGRPTQMPNPILLVLVDVAIFIGSCYIVVILSLMVKRFVEGRRAKLPWRSLCEPPSLGAGAGKGMTHVCTNIKVT